MSASEIIRTGTGIYNRSRQQLLMVMLAKLMLNYYRNFCWDFLLSFLLYLIVIIINVWQRTWKKYTFNFLFVKKYIKAMYRWWWWLSESYGFHVMTFLAVAAAFITISLGSPEVSSSSCRWIIMERSWWQLKINIVMIIQRYVRNHCFIQVTLFLILWMPLTERQKITNNY